MQRINYLLHAIPVAPLGLVALPGCEEIAETIDRFLLQFRREHVAENPDKESVYGYLRDSYLIDCDCPRFGSGESKGILKESVRGYDLFLVVDVCNYSMTYESFGEVRHMSPDDHFQNLKRVIAAVNGKAHRLNVILPFLYESRQHKRTGRESLDAAMALQELSRMGVDNILTFDAHDPRVMNAVPLAGFDNFFPSYQFLKAILRNFPGMELDNDHLMIISPDEGAMSRAVYFANVLGVDMGMFYKRRDYSTIVNGKNPIVAHEFLGDSVEGKCVIVIDDIISSGGSMLDVARQLKDRGAKDVIICATFGLFTDGLDAFDKYYEEGTIAKIITTNLVYQTPELLSRPWYAPALMGKYLANIIDILNHDLSIDLVRDTTLKINRLLDPQFEPEEM